MRAAWVEIYVAGGIGSLPRLHFEPPPGFKHANMEALVRGIAKAFRDAGLNVELKSVLDDRRVLDVAQVEPPVETPETPLMGVPKEPPVVQLDPQCCQVFTRLSETIDRAMLRLESRRRKRRKGRKS